GAGVFAFIATIRPTGSQSLTARDTTTGSITGTQTGIVVNPAATAGFVVTGFTSPTVAGASHSLTVTAKDAYSNTTPAYTGTVAVSSSDSQASLPPNHTFAAADAGVFTFTATLKTAGSQSFTSTDTANGSITGVQSGITVNPAATSNLQVGGFPSPDTAGVSA